MNENPSINRKKLAKDIAKELQASGWDVLPGSSSLETVLQKILAEEAEKNIPSTVGYAKALGKNQIIAHEQASLLAKTDLLKQSGTKKARIFTHELLTLQKDVLKNVKCFVALLQKSLYPLED